MVDPFLQAHIGYVYNVFNLSGRTPLSIRDQIVRAHYLVERLFNSSYLGQNPTLLVVGAGAAGATVATLAARRQADVRLIDASASPFRLQQQCTTRWIDPVQYDWPARHSDAAQWPISGSTPAVPFGFAAGTASSIARGWATTLSMERLLRPNLEVHYGARLKNLPKPVKPAQVSATICLKGRQPIIDQYDAVILARGVFDERTEVPFNAPASSPSTQKFVGRKFWENDTYQMAGFGLPSSMTGQVLVSGSGDGALQDYIRLVTGVDSALRVLSTVFQSISSGSYKGNHKFAPDGCRESSEQGLALEFDQGTGS